MSTKVHQRCRGASESGGKINKLTGKMGIIVSGLEREEGRSKKGHLVPIIPILTIFGFHMLAIQFKKKKKNFKKEK